MADPGDDEPEVSSDRTPAIGEASFSYLGGLADKVRERQSPAQPAKEDGGSGDSENSEDLTITEDPLDMVRELFAERRSQFASGPDIDTGTETRPKILYLGIGLAIALLFTGVLVVAGPPPSAGADQDQEALEDPLATIYLSTEDAEFMNRVFRESSHEVAYCGIIDADGDPSRMEIWLADTVSSSPGQIEFRTNNCPMANREVLLHTHPNGGVGLSETDRTTLASESEEYMCVQAGRLSEEPGSRVDSLACYYGGEYDVNGLQPVRVPVVVIDS